MDNNAFVDPRPMPLHFLMEITNGFSKDRKVGAGAYGTVYKGEQKNGETIAVKLLHEIPGLDAKQFENEYHNIASLQHKNVVRLVGYCDETRREVVPFEGKHVFAEVTKRALCFQYMHNGGLDKYLSDEFFGHDWPRRYAIIKGICEGLKYLHEELHPPMYHLDLKPENVLLDENMDPKIADFGLSRLFGGQKTQRSTSSIGTIGYIPPEYIDTGIISNKYDVFSMGVVIVRIMTGPAGYFRIVEMSSQEFIERVHANWRKRLNTASVYLQDSYSGQVKRCIEIALSCLEGDRHKRPSIGQIVNMLNETETLMKSPYKDIETSASEVGSSKRVADSGNLQVGSSESPADSENLQVGSIKSATDSESLQVGSIKSATDSESLQICHCISSQTRLKDNPLNKLFSYTLDVTDNRGKLHETVISTVCRPEDDASTFEEPIRPKIEIIDCAEDFGFVRAIDVHPTEPWILVGHEDGYVSVWNHQTKARLMAFKEQKVKVLAVRFIARKEWIIAGDDNGKIRVYTYTTTKSKLKEFQAHAGPVWSLAVHPTDPLVLSSSTDDLIKLWNWENSWECIRTFRSHTNTVMSVKFSPLTTASYTFASASRDGTVKIWSMLSDTPITTLKCGTNDLESVDYFVVHGNHEYIVTGSDRGTAQIWDLETGTCIQHIEGLQKYYGCVAVFDCLPGHPILVTISDDHTVSFCNSTTHRYQNKVDFNLGHIEDLAYIKDTRSLVVAGKKGIAIMVVAGEQASGIDDGANSVDGAYVYVGSSKCVADSGNLQVGSSKIPADSESLQVGSIKSAADSESLQVGSIKSAADSESLQICHCISSQTELMDNPLNKLFSYTLDVTDNRGKLYQPVISTVCRPEDDASTFKEPIRPKIEIIDCTEDSGNVVKIDVHPTEPWILVGHDDAYVSVWDHQTKARLMAFKERKIKVVAVRFIARKEWIIAGGHKGQIHVYTYTTTKSKLKEFQAHAGRVWSLAVHPTDPFVLSSSVDKLIKLWNWENGWECIRTFRSHTNDVTSVKFSPLTASNTFASASWDGTVKIWSMLSDTPITTLECGTDLLTSVDYFVVHGNHEYIVTGSLDGTAHIWNLETKTCIQHLEGLKEHIGCVAVLDCLPGHPILVTISDHTVSFCNSTTHRHQNMVDFRVSHIVDLAYIKDTRSLVVAGWKGIAIMEIS